jgi:hypothetical protein
MKVRMWKFEKIKEFLIDFLEKEPSAKEPLGFHDIIIVASTHVEVIIVMTRCGSKDKM